MRHTFTQRTGLHVVWTLLALAPGLASADSIRWDNEGGDSLWSNPANWFNASTAVNTNNFLPGATDIASLVGASSNAIYDNTVPLANQSVGQVFVGDSQPFGTLTINSSSLTVQDNFFAGNNWQGIVNQTGGTVTVQAVGGRFKVANTATATGSQYNLSAGTLNTSNDTFVGSSAAGQFNQTGGTWTNTGASGTQMRIGFANGISAEYNLSGATSVSTHQTITIAAASSYSSGGSGQLLISGGTLNADKIQKGNAAVTGTTAFFLIFGGTVNVGDLEISPSFFESSPAAVPATLNAGTIGVNLNMGRAVAPLNKSRLAPGGLGTIGTTTFASGTTLTENNAACILGIDISGSTSDQILLDLTNGIANLNGSLDINLISAPTLPYYDVLSASAINGSVTLTDPTHFSYEIIPGAGSSETLRVFVPEPTCVGCLFAAAISICAKRTHRRR